MAKKQAAIGCQLWIGDGGSPEQMFLVPSCGDFAGPKKKMSTIETTTHDSSDGYMDFISSLKDGGEVPFPIEFDPNDPAHNETATVPGTNAGGLHYLFESRDKRNMKVVLPVSPSTRFVFLGLVTGIDGDFKVKGSIKSNVTIKISGKPTLELGS